MRAILHELRKHRYCRAGEYRLVSTPPLYVSDAHLSDARSIHGLHPKDVAVFSDLVAYLGGAP